MGGFLAGMLGAAGADIEKQSDRAYQEKRQERLDRMKILELAAGNPSFKREDLGNLFNSLQDVADDARYKSENKAIKDPFKQIGHFVEGIWKKREQKQAQQAIADQAKSDVEGAPGVTTQPQMKVPGIAGGQYNVPAPTQQEMAQAQAQPRQPGFISQDVPGARYERPGTGTEQGRPLPPQYKMVPRRGYTPPMPDSRFDFSKSFRTQAEEDEMARKARKESFETGLEERGRTSQADFEQKQKEVKQLVEQGYTKEHAEQLIYGRQAAPVGPKLLSVYIKGSQIPADVEEDVYGNKIDRSDTSRYKQDPASGKFYPAAAAPTIERLYGLMQAEYHTAIGLGMNHEQALAWAGSQVHFKTGQELSKKQQEMAIAAIRSGVGPGPGFPKAGAPLPGQPAPAAPGAPGQPPRAVTPPMPAPRIVPRGTGAPAAQPTAATAPLRSKLNPREQENAQFYINSLTGGTKATGVSQARAVMGQQALQKLGVMPEDLNARVETRKAAGKALEKLTLITEANEGLENALNRHGKVLTDLRAKLPDSDIRIINDKLIKGGREVDFGGMSDAAIRYGLAMQALRNEYGRVIAGGAASVGQTHVEALHEAARLMAEGFSRHGTAGMVDQLKIETQQRRGGYKDELVKLQGQLRAPLVPELTGGTYQPIESVPQPGGGAAPPTQRKVWNEKTQSFN